MEKKYNIFLKIKQLYRYIVSMHHFSIIHINPGHGWYLYFDAVQKIALNTYDV